MSVPALFRPLELRSLHLSHRGWVSPMCQYSCAPDGPGEGVPTEWHLAHLGAFATGGAALIITEAAAVSADGRISPRDAGLYNEAQVEGWKRVISFVHEHGAADAKIGVQLGHAGRKASTYWPFASHQGSVPASDGGWATAGPSTGAFAGYAAPREMTEAEIRGVIDDFAAAAQRAVRAGFDTVEIHAAHGYLLHQFQSALVNHRTDSWGGSEAGRHRLILEVVDAVRAMIPVDMPLLLRISASDWAEGGVDIAESVRLCTEATRRGVDLVDVSSGGAVAHQDITVGPGYQTRFAQEIREKAQVPTAAVGMISTSVQADHVLVSGQADAVLIARAALRDPHWWLRAAADLGHDLAWTPQYQRGKSSHRF